MVTSTRPVSLGARMPRREDDRLLTGRGEFVADIRLPRMVETVVIRSQVPHARIKQTRLEAARQMPGVLMVAGGQDLEGLSPFPDFFDYAKPVRAFPLALDRVRYVGAPVVVVVAEDRYLAEDAAELVEIDYEELPVISGADDALAPDAARLYEDWPDNKLVDFPDEDMQVARVFDQFRIVGERYRIQRHTAVPIETRGVVAQFRGNRLTVWTATQFPHIVRTTLSYVLPLPERDIRVIAPDVGGGFGSKAQIYPEEALVPWLAMRLGRPVRFIEDRAEHMVATSHARDEVVELEAAVDESGLIQAIRGRILQDAGSGETFPAGFCPALVVKGSLTGPYKIPKQAVSVTSVVTNKTPSGAYRGFGMPEATYVMERLIDRVATELEVDPIDLRRRMLLDVEDLPYVSASGARIDSGSHRSAFEDVLARGQAALARSRDRFRQTPGVVVGVGYANYVEGTVGSFFSTSGHWTAHDSCSIRFDPGGGVVVGTGVSTAGQGLETMVAMLAAEALGVPVEDVRVVMGDTDITPYGLGGWGSRSAGVAAGAIVKGAALLRHKALLIASHILEVAVDDLAIEGGRIHVRGSEDTSTTWGEVATIALVRTLDLPTGIEPGLEVTVDYDPPNIEHLPDENGRANGVATYTNSSHAAVVTVDIETGVVDVVDYLVAHDCGRVINPNLVEGQIEGGVAQGIGGTLYEELPYTDDGQPVAVSFMQYLLPSATEVPPIRITHFESPAPEMAFGIKGAGEAGIIGPAAAISSAVENGLVDFGVRPGDLVSTPITPSGVLELIQRGRARVAAAMAATGRR